MCMSTKPARRSAYHHGNLRVALIEAAVDLARDGGPAAVTVREATRRVGVSPNATYRHFAEVAELLSAVQVEALSRLTESMRAKLSTVGDSGDPEADGLARAHALGLGYVNFALAEPGLFSTAFVGLQRKPARGPVPSTDPEDADLRPTSGEPVISPFRLLYTVLQELETVGLMRVDVETACLIAWANVHGLAQLLLGPLAELSDPARVRLIEASVANLLTGLTEVVPVLVEVEVAVPT